MDSRQYVREQLMQSKPIRAFIQEGVDEWLYAPVPKALFDESAEESVTLDIAAMGVIKYISDDAEQTRRSYTLLMAGNRDAQNNIFLSRDFWLQKHPIHTGCFTSEQRKMAYQVLKHDKNATKEVVYAVTHKNRDSDFWYEDLYYLVQRALNTGRNTYGMVIAQGKDNKEPTLQVVKYDLTLREFLRVPCKVSEQ